MSPNVDIRYLFVTLGLVHLLLGNYQRGLSDLATGALFIILYLIVDTVKVYRRRRAEKEAKQRLDEEACVEHGHDWNDHTCRRCGKRADP